MHDKQLKMLKQIMALQFTVIEFNLYLSNHPCDEEALEDRHKYLRKLDDLRTTYQQKYGPLTPMWYEDQYPWQSGCEHQHENRDKYYWEYIESPWPWQIKY